MEAGTHREDIPQGSRWSFATQVAFRFCFVYFSLYVCVGQMLTSLIPLPGIHFSEVGSRPPVSRLVSWAARRIFHVSSELVVTGSGSGDKTFDWVELFCLGALATVGTAIWLALDRRRPNDVTLFRWFRLFVRLALGSTMLLYGSIKAIPLQMPFPYLSRLVEPFGDFSPMGVLWYSIGASPGYETFLGCMEILGGILVLFPCAVTLGALVCLADAIHVLVLNMTYDVPVKLLSFHMVLLAAFLLAPEVPRLWRFFFLNRGAGPSEHEILFRSARAQRLGAAAQALLVAYVLFMHLASARRGWAQYGGGAPRSELYGIWDVSEMSVDGERRPALLSDGERWRRIIVQNPTFVVVQRMDEKFAPYRGSINALYQTLFLTRGDDKTWLASFDFQRPAPDRLVLDGFMDTHKIHAQLERVDHTAFLLMNRGFHWIQDYPFNR